MQLCRFVPQFLLHRPTAEVTLHSWPDRAVVLWVRVPAQSCRLQHRIGLGGATSTSSRSYAESLTLLLKPCCRTVVSETVFFVGKACSRLRPFRAISLRGCIVQWGNDRRPILPCLLEVHGTGLCVKHAGTATCQGTWSSIRWAYQQLASSSRSVWKVGAALRSSGSAPEASQLLPEV